MTLELYVDLFYEDRDLVTVDIERTNSTKSRRKIHDVKLKSGFPRPFSSALLRLIGPVKKL